MKGLINKIKQVHKSNLHNEKLKYEVPLQKLFTQKQINFILKGAKKAIWTNKDIARGISLRYKNNTYECLRNRGFPLPATRTLQSWTSKIDLKPGILFPVINLLKQEFEFAEELKRQCVISFDEVSIDSGVEYDPKVDIIYGPKTNMNVTFVRGLFDKFKQPIAYDFDDKFTAQKFYEIIEVLEKAGLHVRASVNDMGGKNVGLWNQART